MNTKPDNLLIQIENQLQIMTEEEKENWILDQAKIASESEQKDIYLSLCGSKKVLYMPEKEEIEAFFKSVQDGEICIEYETHYVEFDSEGNYNDDWEYTFHDPNHAMAFITTLMQGCHDLIILEEYVQVFEIIDKLLFIKFIIEEDEDSEDSYTYGEMDLYMADYEALIKVKWDTVLGDYIEACRKTILDQKTAARKIVSALEMKLFRKYCFAASISFPENEPILTYIRSIIESDLKTKEKEYISKEKSNRIYYDEYADRELIQHIMKLKSHFGVKNNVTKKQEKLSLSDSWRQIKRLIRQLQRERYIDDQIEIEEIWNIIDELIKRGGFEKVSWDIKEGVLKEMHDNYYFSNFGVDDPMEKLSKAICTTREENLARAKMMNEQGSGYLAEKAVLLYKELGEEAKYIQYFEEHLGKEKEGYEIVMNYYRNSNHKKAIEIARLALEKCKGEQTPFFILLLEDAKERGDKIEYDRLMKSVHLRRRRVNEREIYEMFNWLERSPE